MRKHLRAATCLFGLAFKRCVAAAREARIFAAFASFRSAAAARAWAAAAKGSVVAAGPEDIVVSKPSMGSPCIVDGRHCGSPSTFGTVGQRFCACKVLNSRGSEDPFFTPFSSTLSRDHL